jgi:hypothetical protein
MAQIRPFLGVVQEDGLDMINVLCCHVAKRGHGLASRGDIGMEIHRIGRFWGQLMVYEGLFQVKIEL